MTEREGRRLRGVQGIIVVMSWALSCTRKKVKTGVCGRVLDCKKMLT